MAKIKLDKLKHQIKNPVLKELNRFEEERKKALIGSTNLSDLQKTLKSPVFQSIFKTQNDYEKYTSSTLENIATKNYQSLQKELEKSCKPYLKVDAQRAMEALGYTNKSISELTKNPYLDQDKYGSYIQDALKNIDRSFNLPESVKTLTASMKKIESDMFQDKMKKLNEQRFDISKIATKPIKIPENPMIKQNKQIIKLLDMQNEALVSTGQYISSQNEKLDTQNKIIEEEIKHNKKSAKQAFWTAIGSIGIAILATIWSVWVTYDIYDKTDKSDNKNHKILLEHIDKNNNIFINQKQTEVLNSIEETMKDNNTFSKDEKINNEKQIEILNAILKTMKQSNVIRGKND